MSQMTMTTNHGDIVLELFDEDAPETMANFRRLAEYSCASPAERHIDDGITRTQVLGKAL